MNRKIKWKLRMLRDYEEEMRNLEELIRFYETKQNSYYCRTELLSIILQLYEEMYVYETLIKKGKEYILSIKE